MFTTRDAAHGDPLAASAIPSRVEHHAAKLFCINTILAMQQPPDCWSRAFVTARELPRPS